MKSTSPRASHPRDIIITADDYGLCDSVNEAIEQCLELGTLTSTNVMVNMPGHPSATRLRGRFPDMALGLHWTISQGNPVLPAGQVPTLLDASGQFLAPSEIRRRWSLGRLNPSELRSELVAQHRRFTELAGPPDYWNTHQNTHLFPGLFQLFVRTGLECGVAAMRSHQRVLAPADGKRRECLLKHPMFALKGLIIGLYARWARRLRVWMPDGLLYPFGYNKHAQIAAVLANPCIPSGGPIEFVVHPATRAEPELFGDVVDSRVTEYHALRDTRLKPVLTASGARLVTFRKPGGRRCS